MNIFFTSDTHFGHRNIIEYCNRPFTSVEDMDDSMVETWNKTVSHGDVVYHLGDMAFHNYDHIKRLKGIIKLVPGNHDHERSKHVFPLVNEVLPEVHYLKIDKERRFVLCHYPFESWRREYPYHLHGHMHGTGTLRTNRLDVGMDSLSERAIYAPVALESVMNRIKAMNILLGVT